MYFPKTLVLSVLAGAATASPFPGNRTYGCGEVSIYSTGLPSHHPLVIAQGADPNFVNSSIKENFAETLAAGYNFRIVLLGPEQPFQDILSDRMAGVQWTGSHIGFGVRGAPIENLTVQFADTIDLFRKKAPLAPTVFDYSPSSALWALQERFPITGNCADSPGEDLGLEVICDICDW
ncbi:hypothetical protein GQ53DRAFT_822840 [Thozetella sp. PMI_491]|nr:hypothetical protein GQ53DRAFT_822840 [Thozetella sp. PMI_491]